MTDLELLDIYSIALLNETGMTLSKEARQKIEFESFRVEFDSVTQRTVITIFGFDDIDSFPRPTDIKIVRTTKHGDTGWYFV